MAQVQTDSGVIDHRKLGRKRAGSVLEAMRRALKTRNKEGGSQEVQAYRELLKAKPETFLLMKARLEAAFQAQKPLKGEASGQKPAEAAKMDEGTERVLELLRELKGVQS